LLDIEERERALLLLAILDERRDAPQPERAAAVIKPRIGSCSTSRVTASRSSSESSQNCLPIGMLLRAPMRSSSRRFEVRLTARFITSRIGGGSSSICSDTASPSNAAS